MKCEGCGVTLKGFLPIGYTKLCIRCWEHGDIKIEERNEEPDELFEIDSKEKLKTYTQEDLNDDKKTN